MVGIVLAYIHQSMVLKLYESLMHIDASVLVHWTLDIPTSTSIHLTHVFSVTLSFL